MQNDKVTSAKNGVSNMLVYYHQALVEAGCGDPKQEIATSLAKMIKLSDSQAEYVIDNSKGLSAQDMLTNIAILLTKMEQDNKIDKSSIALIKQNIVILGKMVKSEPKE